MIIDFHTHAFPDALAERAIAKLVSISGFTPSTDGTVANLKERLKTAGIDAAVLLPVATKATQHQSLNDWARSTVTDGIYAFGSLFPFAPDALDQPEHIKARGLKGIKLHPDYQGFFVDDHALYPLYECIAASGLPLMFHSGFDPLSPTLSHATPTRLAKVVRDIPKLTIIAAHMGSYRFYDDVMRELAGLPLYLEFSQAGTYESKADLLALIQRHGSERILFGTDTPWDNPDRVLQSFLDLNLPNTDRELILCGNASRLLGIS
ncbi:MAG: amidohydrolase family protein [Kiritimatiellia bacterium]|nr:amidohydrolase family protein [Kiritimatiellia bacterium]